MRNSTSAKFVIHFFLLFLLASCGQKEESKDYRSAIIERDEQEKTQFRKQASFLINDKPFMLTADHIASQRLDEYKRSFIKLYFVSETIQSLDMLFFTPPENAKLPCTYKFIPVENAGKDSANYALCFWGQKEMLRWHDFPLENSFITITKWDPRKHLISGTFQLFIQNNENKTDTFKITKGRFDDVRYSDDRAYYR